MSFLIVNVGTEQAYKKPGHISSAVYDTERGAKTACTKLNKKYGDNGQWQVMNTQLFRQTYPVKMVQRINLQSGLPYMEAEDTPLCCSPASETYWSM